MAFIFEKAVGAPAGTITIEVAGNVYIINDSTATTISVPTASEAADLRTIPYLHLQGTDGTPDPPPVILNTSALISGYGAPGPTDGVVGDVYVDINTKRFYGPKDGSGWSSLFTGTSAKAIANQGIGTFTTSVTPGTSTLLVASGTRVEISIWNLSQTATVYLGLGAPAVVGQGIVLGPSTGVWSSTTYTGAVYAVSSTASVALSYVEV